MSPVTMWAVAGAWSRRRFDIVLLLGTAVAYGNSFAGVFQFDDATMLADPRLRNLASYIFRLGGMIRPALQFSFLADRALWGLNPAGYHLLNVLLHVGCARLIYGIVLRIVEERPARFHYLSPAAIPAWSALLFLVHPIATETVTYISGRATGLMACAYLAGIWCHLRATAPGGSMASRSSSMRWRVAALTCFALSLASKETAITFPAALLLVDFVARGLRGAELRRTAWRFHLPAWGLLAAFFIAAALNPRYVHLLKVSRGLRPFFTNLIAQVNVVAYALTLFVAPGRLSIEHDFPASFAAWSTLGAVGAIAGLLVVAIACLRRSPLAAFGLFWFLLQLLPTNSVIPRYDLLSERNLYLAAPGLMLAAVALWSAAVARLRGPGSPPWARVAATGAGVLPLAIAGLLAAATIERNAIYASPVALWSDAVRKAPAKARAHVNLGHAYYEAGELDHAIAEFRLALAIDRDDPVAQQDLLAAWRRKTAADAPR